ncbi:MrcB family domain-containing protein [Halarsenatibacter silvermanii]|uniref:AAA domain (Dynein-related subfamily) n=1 Tax=Halarsenatibacter silvermanii TaxID=321763 RepID=A0A1G9S0L1_9FIRM|nr:DUF3578 domain-containing protein [Halarsenatibacter silvermanii]SDM29039.1 AAA domain (dynein-related subfamily) [Halarsenatibacter silvermanii]
MGLKEDIFDDLKYYDKSYKFVVFKGFLELNDDGKVYIEDLAKYFRDFYLKRKKQNKIIEAQNSVLQEIESMNLSELKDQIVKKPINFVDVLLVEEDQVKIRDVRAWRQLSADDYQEISEFVENKIEKYFDNLTDKIKGNKIENYIEQIGDLDLKSLNDSFKKVVENYAQARMNEMYSGHELGETFRNNMPETIKKYISIKGDLSVDNFKVKGSIGMGNWAKVPWLAIMDKGITTTTQEGVYVVYLFSQDMERVYLTLNQGVTNANSDELKSTKNEVRKKLNLEELNTTDNVKLADSGTGAQYETSTIGYILYEADDILNKQITEEQLIEDLYLLLDYYQAYKDQVYYDNSKRQTVPGSTLSTEEKIAHIKNYLTAHGFYYPSGMLENFYLSLKTKPFVLLAGISGTGKTKLVEHFAHALGCTSENKRYELISVRPDWNDSSDLLGYKNLEGKFVPGPMINILQNAQSNPNDIHIVCLDEMNLARVEYYFSEFLSKMETRHNHNGHILSAPLFTEEDFEKPEDKTEYAGLRIPDNLYIVGTVNMDETTHHFSKKVLDRANTIEFSQVELSQLNLTDSENRPAPLERVDNGFLKPDFISMSDCPGGEEEFIHAQVVDPLSETNNILEKASLHVGYRVRDEIAFYMLYNKRHSLLEHGDREAFDFQLMQKILPRIQGSSQLIKNVIIDLFKLAADVEQFNDMQDNPRKIINQRKNDDPDDGYETMKYPRSAEKLALMHERMQQDGFTSYWL